MSRSTGAGLVPALLTAATAVSVAQAIVISALPALGGDLGVSGTSVTWLLTATRRSRMSDAACSGARSRRRSPGGWATCSATAA